MSKASRFRRVFWALILLAAGVIHFGTAALRVDSFLPTVRAFDFSSYYAAAWSIRLNISPYPFSPDFLVFLAKTQNLPGKPPHFNSAPLWAWLLEPLTVLPFPSAAVLWLLILVGIVICCHVLLVKIAGYRGWKIVLVTLPITVTFGPMFLDLTLGQNAVLLLLCALIMGEALRNNSRYSAALWIPFWIIAVAGKIFPVLWLGCPPFLKRPRRILLVSSLCLAVFLAGAFLKPVANDAYWRHYIFDWTQRYAQRGGGIDDQSIKAFLGRIAKSGQFNIHGLSVHDMEKVTWNLPWEFSDQCIYWVSTAAVVLIGMWLLYSWIRSRNRSPDAELYSLILFTLIFFPHIQRYNHLLALPAMARLWQRGAWGRNFTITAYALFALSRLNHVWATLLPSTLAAMASGFGLFGVLTLFAGITRSFLMPLREEPLLVAPA
jgi:hypothetical protein